MANINSNSVILAVAMTISKETDLGSLGRDLLDINTEFVLGSLLFLPSDGILEHLVVEVGRLCSRTIQAPCHD